MVLSDRSKDTIVYNVARLISLILSVPGKNFHNGVVSNLIPKSLRTANFSIELDVPQLTSPDPDDNPLFERIFEALVKAKSDQGSVNSVYLPSTRWQETLDSTFHEVKASVENRKTEPLANFLSNFGSWPGYIGIESGSILVRAHKHPSLRNQLFRDMHQRLEWWIESEKGERKIDCLSYPRHGNQAGFRVQGAFVGYGSTGNDYLGARIASLMPAKSSRICEVGGGYGKLLYFLSQHLKHKSFFYLNFDLPEVLTCAAYYLIKSFPDKVVTLYGEYDDLSTAIERSDIVLVPGWEIEKLHDHNFDLLLNKNSFGEMNPETATKYIETLAPRADIFFHLNHEGAPENFGAGKRALSNGEYPIPENFELISRSLDPMSMMVTDYAPPDIYEYIYRKR